MQKKTRVWQFVMAVCLFSTALTWGLDKPIVAPDVIFEEVDGMVAVEAEFFTKQTKLDKRRWYRTSANEAASVGRDPDGTHVANASNNAYIEILPDTRVTHGDKLINDENFCGTAGAMAVVHYQVYFNTPGRYYVWVRAHSTGSEDNGLHVGIDGTWPDTGQRLQWCAGKRTWRWESKQRTNKNHCGEPYKIYLDVEAGLHEITFSMREDGFEFDKWIMTKDRDFKRPEDAGSAVRIKQGVVPPPYPVVKADPQPKVQSAPAAHAPAAPAKLKVMKATAFPADGTRFYVDQNKWLAINPNQNKEAETRMPFPFADGHYDVVFFAVGENDGKSQFWVSRNDQEIGHFVCPLSTEMFAEGKPHNILWENVSLKKGDAISVKAKVGTDGQEFSRGRWVGMAFVKPGQGKKVVNTKLGAKPAPAPVAKMVQPHAQLVGLRFQKVDLAKGTKVKKATIQFTVDEAKNANPLKITIAGQAHDDAPAFGMSSKNISKRKATKAKIVWKDAKDWTTVGQAGPDQQTPDLSPIVNEILARNHWTPGNAMAFVFKGSGIRTAMSFEKDKQKAATLIVLLTSGEKKTFPLLAADDDMEEVAATGMIDSGSSDLELGWEEIAPMQAAAPAAASAPIKKGLDLKTFFSNPKIRLLDGKGAVTISGEKRQWHKVTLTLDGPYAHELDTKPNPFTDYKMTVVFKHSSGQPVYTVPGYFAADGDAAQSGADSGTQWRAHLSPCKTGTWNYEVQFVQGKDVTISDNPGTPVKAYHGKSGSFRIRKTNKKKPDMRAQGLLQYVGERYLKFAGTGEIFLKCGADAPENLLSYADFDGPFKEDGHKDNLVKTWEAHVKDWEKGDPSWQGGKGKGLIGAINYLASEGMNAFSFLTNNIIGDDRNVFPYIHYDARFNMDCSRLDQWEIVFEHGTKLGMFLHFKTLEAENTRLLDDGQLGPQRKLYYRELIARFAHHPALNWNIGEEVGYKIKVDTQMKKDWAEYFWKNDPYQHHIVIHNGNNHFDLLGPADKGGSYVTGFSLQTGQPDFKHVHGATLNYLNRSAKAGKQWAVACDEPGDASHSLVPDADDNGVHRNARVNALWGVFTAGGWGIEWYFGYKHAHSDLTCEDWRSRDLFWDQCRHALNFFKEVDLPLSDMANANSLVEGDAFCLAKADGPYLVVLKTGGTVTLDVSAAQGELNTRWFNPRTGKFIKGKKINAGQKVTLGPAPVEPNMDWVVLVD